MVELEYVYEQNKIFMQANLTSTIITKYYQKTFIEPNSIIFFLLILLKFKKI